MRRRHLRPWGPDAGAELEAEFEFHIEMRAAELMRGGVAPEEARRQARREFGDAESARRQCRSIDRRRFGRVRRVEAAEALWFDLRAAWASLWRARGYATGALLTLALAIAGATVVFSAVDAVLLRALPFAEPERLVRVQGSVEGRATTLSLPDFVDIRAQSRTLRHVSAWHADAYTLTGRGSAVRLRATRVTADFFNALGVPLTLGSDFEEEHMVPGRHRVAILSDGLWRGRFGADPGVLGTQIMLDGEAHTVIGVAPREAEFPERTEVWAPREHDAETYATQRGARYLSALARLAPGATLEGARREVAAIARGIEREYADTNTGLAADVDGLRESLVGAYRRPLLVLLGAVLFVLVIAGANVASLALVRTLGRSRELAVRAALGARRMRVLRLLLGESVLIALLASVLGSVLAVWGVRVLVLALGEQVPRLAGARVDASAVAFALLASAVAALLAGIYPALRYSRAAELYQRLAESGRGRTTGRSGARLRSVLVSIETALALLLLVGAGLLVRSFDRLSDVDPGFRAEGLLTAEMALPEETYDSPERIGSFYASLLEEVRALPGVQAAGAVMAAPMSGTRYSISVEVLDGAPAYEDPAASKSLQVRVATPGYMEAAGIALRRGRLLEPADRDGGTLAVVVSESAARLLWPDADPLGRSVELGTRLGVGRDRPRVGGVVVGVVGDVREFGPAEPTPPTLYAAHAQFPLNWMTLAIRSSGDPNDLVGPLRALVARVDPELPLSAVSTGEDLLGRTLQRDRFYALLLSLFAGAAALLAGIGIYGITASAVASRTREIGIRMAIGAAGVDVLRYILRGTLRSATIGIAAGLLGALVLTDLLRSLLFELSPTDPPTIAAVTLLLALIALVAAWVPARRATRVDPTEALRAE